MDDEQLLNFYRNSDESSTDESSSDENNNNENDNNENDSNENEILINQNNNIQKKTENTSNIIISNNDTIDNNNNNEIENAEISIEQIENIINQYNFENNNYNLIDNLISIDNNLINNRLEKYNNLLKDFIMNEYNIKPFYKFLTYVGLESTEISKVLDSNTFTINNYPLLNEEESKIFMSKLNYLIGPNPNKLNYISYSSKNMISLENLKSVSDFSNNLSPLFYCILNNPNNENDNNYNFIDGIISYNNKIITKNKKIYSIKKFTDRVTMRLILRKYFNDDELKITFSLFILENTHMILINKKYIYKNNNILIFDLYSFINDIIKTYRNNDNLLYFNSFKNIIESSNVRNREITEMGIKIDGNEISDSTTIAYIYWLYEINYFSIYKFYDKSWLRNTSSIIRTVKDSTLKQLAFYSIIKLEDYNLNYDLLPNYNDLDNILLNNSTVPKEIIIKKFSKDMLYYYNNIEIENCKNNIINYFSLFYDKINIIEFCYIFPLFYSCNENNIIYDFIDKINTKNYNLKEYISNIELEKKQIKKIIKNENNGIYIPIEKKKKKKESNYSKSILIDSSNQIYIPPKNKKEKKKEIIYNNNNNNLENNTRIYIPPKNKKERKKEIIYSNNNNKIKEENNNIYIPPKKILKELEKEKEIEEEINEYDSDFSFFSFFKKLFKG